ncbi:hypothetical protein [Oryza sativa Japonica Group]|uniref:Uncharacterized protein n=2 Tax=Oryza TaxID=4527 RepID=Q5ZDD9_ORYSJ|nr:hypothetical protein [Oryza sativa Japonica Group]
MNPTRRPRRRERSRAAEVEQTLPEACGGTDEATEGARAVPEKRAMENKHNLISEPTRPVPLTSHHLAKWFQVLRALHFGVPIC